MIKRLKTKFVWVFMVIVAVLLLAIFGLICNSTYKEMRSAAMDALQAAAFEPGRPGDAPDGMKPGLFPEENKGEGKGDNGHLRANPCFLLRLTAQDTLQVQGSEFYDLSDEQKLLQILHAAQETGQKTGILYQWNLRFLCLDTAQETCYAFLDISNEIKTMNTLVLSCGMFGLVALAAFFVVAVLLAGWLVKPVEEAFIAQRQFVADASHELKTPLTVILTNAELLQSEEYDAVTKQRFVGSIYAMSTQMRGLVESLLQLARVDSTNAANQMHTVCFSQLVEECVLPFEPVYFEAGRTLDSQIDPDIRVLGIEQQLHQVVDILLDNGQKYSQPGSMVTLKLALLGNHCQLSVTSQGAPLSQQQCKEIFKRFYRADEARSMNHSYGLGLPIAEGIVTRHKGRIWCQSKNGWNTFYVNLPVCGMKN